MRIALGAPLLLPLLLVAIVAAGFYVWVFRRRQAAERRYANTAIASLRSATLSPRRQIIKAALVVAALALLGLAAARPLIGTHRTLLSREGTDIIIALDVSLSMGAADAQPSRLERAKADIGSLLDHLQGDRVGLVTFAGSADLRFPLTTDLEAARKVVLTVGFKDGGLQPGTSLSGALREATTGFVNDNTRSKVLLLVSDGEDLGDDAASAATFAREQGIALDTLAVGHEDPIILTTVNPQNGARVPRIDPATGQPLTTLANPKALTALAAANRGRAYDGNGDEFAAQLADEIGRLQKTRFESGEGDLPIERFQWLIGAALALLAFELLLPAGHRPWWGGVLSAAALRRWWERHGTRGGGLRMLRGAK